MCLLKRSVVAAAVALAWSTGSFALTPAPAVPAATPADVAAPTPASPAAMGDPNIAKQIRDINERMMLLKTQLDEITLQIQLEQKRAERAKASGATAPGINGAEQPPTVVSIEGIDKKLKAKLSFGNGLTKVVSKGDQVNGWLISDISPFAVVVSYGKETLSLSFGAEPPPTPPQLPPGASPAPRN
jgi:type IV pilus biogenesis protein PilP